ncbi:TetR family transcriptional regulator [Paenibacillus cellulosilyticus]|uniref:TetR family transcriptional regulator n=1 Tax=Paenibacillus cellulosilyticus TaxID=375489 RepID=A0A2V2YU48_9BACL|nr:TetR/AcrR family transcriptional regulator [Paenibacillus cellulosilyticus]PWW02935.1 TetR family transcriptional regulator [Paenibacillus cellulosilyticus]QKS45842.1 TetR/AcrR family transcriptional regulator [Paenibacillus cellulosilyticus]
MKKPEEQPGFRYNDLECKCRLANKLLAPFRATGFQQLRMDDIAKQMDISKATLYKYFSSKDEIIDLIVDQFVNSVEENDAEDLPGAENSYEVRFRNTFVRTLMIASYRSEPFLRDLRETFPELYGKLESAIAARNERLCTFYEQGMNEGVFNPQNATLLLMQDELIFRNLMDPIYLMKHHLTLRNALWDYYLIKKRQLLSSPKDDGDEVMRERLDKLASKFMYGVS